MSPSIRDTEFRLLLARKRRSAISEEGYYWFSLSEAVIESGLKEAALLRGHPLAGLHAQYATSVYSGARAGEVAALTWPRVDLERRLITISASFDNPTKNTLIRHVPILDTLLPILKRWKLQCPITEDGLVFPNVRVNMHKRRARVFKHSPKNMAVFATGRTRHPVQLYRSRRLRRGAHRPTFSANSSCHPA